MSMAELKELAVVLIVTALVFGPLIAGVHTLSQPKPARSGPSSAAARGWRGLLARTSLSFRRQPGQ